MAVPSLFTPLSEPLAELAEWNAKWLAKLLVEWLAANLLAKRLAKLLTIWPILDEYNSLGLKRFGLVIGTICSRL